MSPRFFVFAKDAWEAMLEDVRNAQNSIDIEQYIFISDSIGKKFLNVFREKIAQGVRIRIICDMVGSYSFYRSPTPALLRSMGIEIRFFNPVSLWRITNFTSNFFRDHRKMLVVDSKIGYIGGVCIQENMENWRDTMVRMTGPVVTDMLESFNVMWEQIGKGKVHIRFPKPVLNLFNLVNRFIVNSPWFNQRRIYKMLVNRIRTAKKYIYLTTPYYIPEIKLIRALRAAAKRGVDIRIVIPEITDHYLLKHGRESYFTLTLNVGAKIYIYKDVMLHAKTAVIDDEWATVGSFNLDSLSFFYNHEANVASTDPEFVMPVKEQFLKDCERSSEIVYSEWIKRPLLKKFLELLTWPFHGIM